VADILVVYNDQNVIFKKSASICKAMKPIMNIEWKPLKFNGKAVRMRTDVDYTIEFIYRE